jgi:hypothetical protein
MRKATAFILAATLAISAGSWTAPLAQVAYAAPHGGHVGGGFRGHGGGGHFRGGLWIGGPWWWDPFFYPYYPYYPSYPYYSQPPVVIQQLPQEYVMPEQQREESSYWYYCRNPKGYYPYIKRCPEGWLKVVPTPPAGEEE